MRLDSARRELGLGAEVRLERRHWTLVEQTGANTVLCRLSPPAAVFLAGTGHETTVYRYDVQQLLAGFGPLMRPAALSARAKLAGALTRGGALELSIDELHAVRAVIDAQRAAHVEFSPELDKLSLQLRSYLAETEPGTHGSSAE